MNQGSGTVLTELDKINILTKLTASFVTEQSLLQQLRTELATRISSAKN